MLTVNASTLRRHPAFRLRCSQIYATSRAVRSALRRYPQHVLAPRARVLRVTKASDPAQTLGYVLFFRARRIKPSANSGQST